MQRLLFGLLFAFAVTWGFASPAAPDLSGVWVRGDGTRLEGFRAGEDLDFRLLDPDHPDRDGRVVIRNLRWDGSKQVYSGGTLSIRTKKTTVEMTCEVRRIDDKTIEITAKWWLVEKAEKLVRP